MRSCERCAVPHLIPVVTATCPRRLNHPHTHDAKGAFSGFDIIAAQKYGPPLVGCALQTSAIARPTSIVKTAEKKRN